MARGPHESTSVTIAGHKLARELQVRGLSGKDFAKLAHINASTLSGILVHDNPVSTRTAMRIARALRDAPVDAELAAIVADEVA